jgi:uncharacterized membrane-anchored protein
LAPLWPTLPIGRLGSAIPAVRHCCLSAYSLCSEGTISVNTVTTPKVEVFYWAAIMFSQTLGTPLGDWVADTGGLGYHGGALVFAAGLAVIGGLYLWTKVSCLALLECFHPFAAVWCYSRRLSG